MATPYVLALERTEDSEPRRLMLAAAGLARVEDQSVGHRVRGGALSCQLMGRRP